MALAYARFGGRALRARIVVYNVYQTLALSITLTTVYEKGPYEENICFSKNICFLERIFFVRPLLEHGVYEKEPCAHACARLSRLSFRALLTSG